jgi:hypothetical protein
VSPRAVPLRVALYFLTALSAAAVLFVEPSLAGAVRRGALGIAWLFLPLAVYSMFLLAYAIDRVLLVRRRRYPVGRALFQVAFGVMFALMLLPRTIQEYRAVRHNQPTGTARLLAHRDPAVRGAAALALGFKGQAAERARMLVPLLDDPSPEVRQAAGDVLATWSGRSPDDVAGIRQWASALSASSTVTRGASGP